MQLVSGDILLLVLEVLAMSEVKRRYPNLFFLGKGANVFLPPQQQPIKEQEQPKDAKKRGKKPHEKTEFPVQYISAELNQLNHFPLYDEYEKVAMITAVLVFHVVLKLVLQPLAFLPEFLTHTTSLPFLVTFLLLLYAAKYSFRVSTHNGYFTYEFKAAIAVTAVTTALFLSVRLLSRDYLPKFFEYAVAAQTKHFNMLLTGLVTEPLELNSSSILFVVLVFSGLLTLLNVPSIIKYGNAYTQMLQESHEGEDNPAEQLEDKSAGELVAVAKLKLECRKQLKIFNIELIIWTAIVLFWGLPMVRQEFSQNMLFWILACLLAVATYVNILNYRHEIDLHLSNAYIHIQKLQKETNRTEEFVRGIQRKVYSYIYLFWYPSYQLLLRFVVPVLLFMMLTQKTYLNSQSESYEGAKYHYAINTASKEAVRVNLETSCGLIKDSVLMLKQLHKCPANADLELKEVGINGWQLSHSESSIGVIANKVSTYGLLVKVFQVALLQQLCWYYLLSRYALTIFYIIFLRKTVMNI